MLSNQNPAFIQSGGHSSYGCFKLTYTEPALLGMKFKENNVEYKKGLCPIAEKVQPNLMLLKTNFVDMDYAKDQANILQKTINKLS